MSKQLLATEERMIYQTLLSVGKVTTVVDMTSPRFISRLLAAELAEDMTRIQGLYLGYWLQNWLRI